MTGRLPREILYYKKCLENDQEYENSRILAYKTRLEKLNYNILPLLEKIFELGFFPKIPGDFYDQGLFYFNENRQLQIINSPAKKALLQYYCDKTSIQSVFSNNVWIFFKKILIILNLNF